MFHDVELDHVGIGGRHHVHFCPNGLFTELKVIERPFAPHAVNVFTSAEEKSLAGANGRAHRFFSDARAVETHVALHHLINCSNVLRDAKWAGEHTIGASNASRLHGTVNDSILVLLDRIGRTHCRTRGVFAAVSYTHLTLPTSD